MAVRRGRGYTGLSSVDATTDFCRHSLAVTTFGECRYPFYTVAVSLGQGRKVVFSAGELAPRMVASAAIPILYRPVKIDGEYYCDGALIELAPMDAICCKHQLDAVIIHHVSQKLDWLGLTPVTAVLAARALGCSLASLYAWWLSRRALRPLDAIPGGQAGARR
jgi:predicted acylesterase/phospholipase RssA